jgi:hypothetical protein
LLLEVVVAATPEALAVVALAVLEQEQDCL